MPLRGKCHATVFYIYPIAFGSTYVGRLRLLRLLTTHQAKKHSPTHTNQASNQHPMLHRHQRQIEQTNSRPQLLPSRHKRPESHLRRLPPILPALSSQHSNPHDEKHRVHSSTECLIEQELRSSILDIQLLLQLLHIRRRVLRSRCLLLVARPQACLLSPGRLASDSFVNQAFLLFPRKRVGVGRESRLEPGLPEEVRWAREEGEGGEGG